MYKIYYLPTGDPVKPLFPFDPEGFQSKEEAENYITSGKIFKFNYKVYISDAPAPMHKFVVPEYLLTVIEA